MYQFLRDQEIPEAAEIVEPGLHLDPPLLPHHSVVVPQVHPGDILDPFSQEVQYIADLPGVLPQGIVLPVHRLLAGHEHPHLCRIPIHPAWDQLCTLLLDLFAMEVDVQHIAQMLQLALVKMRGHLGYNLLQYLLYHDILPPYLKMFLFILKSVISGQI